MGDDADVWSEAQEIQSILPLKIGHRDDLPLLPEQPTRKAGDVAHMDARTDNATNLADGSQRQGHEVAHDTKDDCGIERRWRHLVRSAGPSVAQAPGEGLRGNISRPRKGKH